MTPAHDPGLPDGHLATPGGGLQEFLDVLITNSSAIPYDLAMGEDDHFFGLDHPVPTRMPLAKELQTEEQRADYITRMQQEMECVPRARSRR